MNIAPGVRLGPYEIVAAIGAGGMGEVYRARDTRLDRTVAIKVLPSQFAADLRLRDRFDREARAISSLSHPHICALFDVGRQEGVDFLVLEFLEGETLADRLARAGALPVPDALKIATEICDALDKAHRAGIVHRDLKPANVFIAYMQGSTNFDVWILPVAGDRKPFPLANSSFAEDAATFSPDGRWIAYSSNESGQYQVYVRPFPPSAGTYPISRNGGGLPMWRGDGRELFFIAPDLMMMATTIDTARQFQAGVPQPLFASHSAIAVQGRRQYAVTKDGKRFLVAAVQQAAGSAPLTVVVNWIASVQR